MGMLAGSSNGSLSIKDRVSNQQKRWRQRPQTLHPNIKVCTSRMCTRLKCLGKKGVATEMVFTTQNLPWNSDMHFHDLSC